MTEAEWLTCDDPGVMLEFSREWRTERKSRWFVNACIRRLGPRVICEMVFDLFEASERYADGLISAEDLYQAHRKTPFDSDGHPVLRTSVIPCPAELIASMATWSAGFLVTRDTESAAFQEIVREARIHQAHLARCVFDNPFTRLQFPPTWRTGTTVPLAQAAYDERTLPSGELDADRLAVLADALEDAGATGGILAHLRGPGPHVRGCWALDLALGKE